jgi:phenylalanyl-tRNA synthetase beta chain
LICELAGGTATGNALDVYPQPVASRAVNLRPNRIQAITSLKVSENESRRILKTLGFERRTGDTPMLTFTVPSWRHDVSIEEDLVEEVARHTGYDRIETELPPATLAGEYHTSEKRKRALRQALAARGLDEAINLSFLQAVNDYELLPAFGEVRESVTLTNPIIEDASSMRQTLIPGLLNSVRHNLNQGIRDVCLFETGRLFGASPDKQLPAEREALALVATGGKLEAGKAQPVRDLDFFDLKGAVEAAVEAMNLPPFRFAAAGVKHLHAGQAATITANGTALGTIGRLAGTIANSYKFRQAVYVAELDLTALLEMPERPVLYSPLPRFPSIVRDVSLLVDRTVSAGDLAAAAEREKADLFAGVSFVGTYEGEGISTDQRSITLRFEYRASDRTLRDEEVDGVHWPIVEALKKSFGAEVR